MSTRSVAPILALTALVAVACEPTAKPLAPLEVLQPSARLTALLPSAEASTPPTSPQMVSNFASLTVQDEGGKDVPLTMDGLSIKVTIAGRMARTEVTQVFRNHTNRRTEGVYEFSLPEGAAISRLAMDVNGVMTEGELVEKERARKIYDQIVASMKDPALLEWQGGNRFKTSIFPIEPKSDKKVVLTYEQLLPSALGEVRYRYSMPNLTSEPDGTRIGSYAFTLETDAKAAPKVIGYDALKNATGLQMASKDFVPSGPVDIVLRDTGESGATVLYASAEDENFFVADVRPALPKQATAGHRDLVIALDTSASIGQPELDRAKQLIAGLTAAMSDKSRVQIVHGDHKVWNCFNRGALKSEVQAVVDRCLKPLDAAGGSDLAALVGRAGEQAKDMKRPTTVVLISEGTASLGELDGDLIRARFAERVGGADVNLHTVALGHTPNEDGLEQLARALGGHHTRLRPNTPVAGTVETVSALVREPLFRDVKIEVTQGSVEGLSPRQAVNLAPGQSLSVLGKLDTRTAVLKITGTYNNRPVEQTVELKAGQGASHGIVRNFWARSSIEHQVSASADRSGVVEFSKKYGVMSPYTSFLVLENDAAYKRFKVDRKKDRERLAAEQEARVTGNIAKGKDSLQSLLKKPSNQPAPRGPGEGKADKKAMDRAEEAKPEPAFEEVELARDMPAPPADKAARPAAAPKRRARRRPARMDEMNLDAASINLGGISGDDSIGGEGRFGLRRATGMGIVGKGGGGGGRGRGIGYGSINFPSMASGVPTVEGKLDVRVVTRVVRRHRNRMLGCYRLAASDREPVGAITLKWAISPDGTVLKVNRVSSSLRERDVEDCLVRVAHRWRFPKPDGEGMALVTQTFSFLPNADTMRAKPAKYIPLLEKRLATLSRAEQNTLLDLYLTTEAPDKAKEAFATFTEGLEGDALHDAVLAIVTTARPQALFDAPWLAATRYRFAKNPSDGTLAQALFNRHLQTKDWPAIKADFGGVKLAAWSAGSMLRQLINADRDQDARSLFGAWRKSGLYTSRDLVGVIDAEPALAVRFDPELHAVLIDAINGGEATEAIFARLLSLGVRLKEPQASRKAIIDHCTGVQANVSWCRRWLNTEKTSHPELGKVMSDAQPAWLAALRHQRSTDVANSALIKDMADILESLGHKAASQRLLSELVEYTPHHYGRRMEYAKALAERDLAVDACASYSIAVQLEPKQRDTFKTMMKLRRQHEKDATAIKDCIVQGVSNLPVHRDVSLVLTWEDPTADVDLHIHEVGGEEVFYQHRTSKIGGFLYYDIIDGYGPEIYALGDGPKGEYRLTLVYYGGDAKHVKAKVTILKNAGAANETREVVNFTLPESNTEKQYPIGTFNL